MIIGYNSKNIRDLLTKGFSAAELRTLCFDHSDFKPVYEQLTESIGKDQIIHRLIEHASQKRLFDPLLTWAKENNPARYEEFQPYYTTSGDREKSEGTHMRLTVKHRYQNLEEREFSTGKTDLIIGCSTEGEVDLDLSPDTRVSTPHARLYYDLSTWWVADLNSVNGTFFKGEKLTEPMHLYSGAELQIGDTTLRLEFESTIKDTLDLSNGIIDVEQTVDDTQPNKDVSESERLEILASIYGIAGTMQGQSMLNALIDFLLERFTLADRASIVVHRDKELVPVAFSEMDQAYVSFTLARRAIVKKQAFIWERAVASASSLLISSLRGVVSAIYAPIIVDRRARGVIQLDTNSYSASFTENDLNHLGEIASIIGKLVNIDNDVLRKIPSVFVSYSQHDKEFVQKLASDLRRSPVSVWFDERLRVGQNWREQIGLAIDAANAFLFVMSPTSVSSEHVRWEIDRAKESRKLIFPLMYLDCDVPDDFKDIQHLKIDEDYDDVVAELVDELYDLIASR